MGVQNISFLAFFALFHGLLCLFLNMKRIWTVKEANAGQEAAAEDLRGQRDHAEIL